MIMDEVISMTCPNCGAIFEENCRFCGACGTPLTIENKKKGTHRVPILIMLVLAIIGTCVFFATGGNLVPEPGDLSEMDFGFGEEFMVYDGMLYANTFLLEGETEITVPETVDGQTVTAIDDYGLSDLTNATAIYLPDTVEALGVGALSHCWSLRGMDLPPSLKFIGDMAFYECSDLEAIHIPASVEAIGEDAFARCGSLAFIFYDGTIDQWKALYPQDLPDETAVCCTDGTFFQEN